ncbi:MAG: hypothetical protein HKN43_12575 [Rhodothermales bacterium]|nr:hypothetical protein [Rhodothermales bacterium]
MSTIDYRINIGLLVAGVLLSALAFSGWFSAGSGFDPVDKPQIILPVEVLGSTGLTRVVEVVVDEAADIDRLYLQVHSPGYKYGAGDKVSVQVNSSPWIDISNKTVTCYYPESHYECVGGAFATVRFTIPAKDVSRGLNTVRFRFNGTDGITSGFRVLDFNFLRSDGSPVLPPEMFAYEDPAGWQPPSNREEDIAAGRRLWHEAVLADNPLNENHTIRAACSDCHATSGMDLKYFGYSNESIIARSVFHALSEEEGEQIASYIRTLPGKSYGTPWDPPYQPGPGIDSRPASAWAAGAGLEAVLEHDSDAIPYMFPNGIRWQEIAADSTINIREIPIAIQLPDWNEWLPRVHPVDAWGDAFARSATATGYEQTVQPLIDGNASTQQALRSLERWNRSFRRDRSDGLNEDAFGGYDSDGVVADYTLGLHQWQAVKTFEVMVGGSYQDKAYEVYGDDAEPLSWFGNSRSLFDVGPHISGPVQVSPYPHGSPLQNIFMTTAWYELQLIVNSGNRHGLSIRPMDWKYHYGHIADISKWSGIDEPVRYLKSYVKNMQEATNSRCGPGSDCGFYFRHLTPARLVVSQSEVAQKGAGRSARGRQRDAGGSDKNLFDTLPVDVKTQLIEAVLRVHVKELLRYPTSAWPRGDDRQALPGQETIPTLQSGRKQFDMTSYADHYYRSIPIFKNIGVSPTLIDSLSGWGQTMWPEADWQFKN